MKIRSKTLLITSQIIDVAKSLASFAKPGFLSIILFISVSARSQDSPIETADKAVTNMRLGWNLGNTLDANSGDVDNMWIERWSSRTPADYEKSWGQVPTTQALIDMMRDAGINAIRVPVTWYPHMVKTWAWVDGSTKWDQTKAPIEKYMNEAWMRRVKQTVDYIINAGMYCVLNVHHDTGAANTAWIRASMDNYQRNRELYEWLWTRIAEEFKNYGDHLIFEGYNEMLDEKSSWCFASFSYDGNYNASAASDSYDAINHYAQTFVDAVRATGGNNATRNLMVNTYGACNGDGNWSTHLAEPLTNMKLPEDSTDGHIILQVHYYPSFSTLSEGKGSTNSLCRVLKSKLASKGAPVVVGEWGAADDSKVSYVKNSEVFLQWARYFVEHAKQNGIGTFLWMGLSDGEARSVPQFSQPDLLEAIVKGYYGEEGYSSSIGSPQICSQSDGAVYSLSGQQIKPSAHQPGIYIQNGSKGRKVMLKKKVVSDLRMSK